MNNGLDHKATLKDIATKVGVSVTAASLVLNNRRVRISKEKRDRILQVAKQLDYRPNQVARNLAAGMSRTDCADCAEHRESILCIVGETA